MHSGIGSSVSVRPTYEEAEAPLTSFGESNVDEGDEDKEEHELSDASLRLPASLSEPQPWYKQHLNNTIPANELHRFRNVLLSFECLSSLVDRSPFPEEFTRRFDGLNQDAFGAEVDLLLVELMTVDGASQIPQLPSSDELALYGCLHRFSKEELQMRVLLLHNLQRLLAEALPFIDLGFLEGRSSFGALLLRGRGFVPAALKEEAWQRALQASKVTAAIVVPEFSIDAGKNDMFLQLFEALRKIPPASLRRLSDTPPFVVKGVDPTTCLFRACQELSSTALPLFVKWSVPIFVIVIAFSLI